MCKKLTFKDLDFPSFNRLDVTLEIATRSSKTTVTNFIFCTGLEEESFQ